MIDICRFKRIISTKRWFSLRICRGRDGTTLGEERREKERSLFKFWDGVFIDNEKRMFINNTFNEKILFL